MLKYLGIDNNNKNKVILYSASLTPFFVIFIILTIVFLKSKNPKNKFIQILFWIIIVAIILYIIAVFFAMATCYNFSVSCERMTGR